ncbi:sodium:solute symporter [candidate division KSB1 bacterium]
MAGMNIADIIIMIVYFAVMIGIGIYSARKTKDQEGFFMGGRSFGKILQTFAAFGAGTSADSPIGTVRNIVVMGLSGIWTVLNWLFCTPFYWFMGKWYRRMRIITTGDFYDERYDSKGLAGTYAIFALIFFMGYISIGFSAASKTIVAIAPKSIEKLTIVEKEELTDFNRIQELEERDYSLLTVTEKNELDNLRVENPRGLFPFMNVNLLIFIMGMVTLVYSVMGGLTAAYFTDLIQGTMIIFLSLILIPFAMIGISNKFGGESFLDSFSIMHAKVPEEFFDIFGSAHASDFTWYYVLAIVLMNLVGIIVQPHQLSVGGATAKDELSGQIGIVTGNLLKRLCTIMWAVVALLVLTLFKGEFSDPDLAWGYATRMLLGPLGIGLVGLMIASLFAAIMSSVSAYLVASSALIVRNLYKPFFPARSEKFYVNIGRTAGIIVILGAMYLSIYFQDIFVQFKFIWEIPIIFGASFWIGLFWRRATKTAVWTSVLVSAILFFILPATLPTMVSGLRANQEYILMTNPAPITRVYEAKGFDVDERNIEIAKWENISEDQKLLIPKPGILHIGDKIQKTTKPKGVSIFWTKGIEVYEDGGMEGQGLFNIEMLLYKKLGIQLDKLPNALIETMRLPLRIFLPILLIILISFISKPASKAKLDRFFVKMHIPVVPDMDKDRANVEAGWKNPESIEQLKAFPNSNFEFLKLTKADVIGFSVVWVIVILIILIAMGIGLIGA